MEGPHASEHMHIEYRHHNLKSGHKIWIMESVNREYCLVEQSDGNRHAAIAEASQKLLSIARWKLLLQTRATPRRFHDSQLAVGKRR